AFPFPDLQSGSLLEFKIKFSSTGKTLSPKLFDQYLFSSSVPVSTARYKITYPGYLKPNIRVIGGDVLRSESTDGEKISEVFEYSYPPVFNLAYESVSIYDVSPQVLVGFYDSWDEVSLWYNGIFERAVSAKDGDLDEALLKELAIYEPDKLKTVEKIYQYVQKNIRYVALELGEGAMVPHTPKEIYKNKFGDCKDQAVFMAYILNLFGIDAKPALISTIDNGRVNEEIPSPYYFNHVIVYIPVQNGISSEIFCDTTSSVTQFLNLPSVDQGVRGLVVDKSGAGFFATTPVIAPEQNRIVEIYKAALNLSGSGEIFYSETFSGSYSEILRYSFINRSEKEIEGYLLDIQKKNFPQLKPQNFSLKGAKEQSGPIEASYSAFEKNLASVFYDGRLKIKYTVGNLAGFLNLPEKSNFDHRRDFLSSYYKMIEYKAPENYDIIEGEVRNFSRENKYVYLDFKVDKKEVNTLTFEFELKFKKRTIPKEDLPELHKTLNEFTSATTFELTLANTKDFDHIGFYESLVKDYELKEAYENYIRKMIELRNYDKAMEVSNRAISKFKDHINFYLIKSSIQFDRGDNKGAENTLLAALSVDSKNVEIYYYLIDLYKKSSNDMKLEKILLEINEKIPNNPAFIGETTSFYNRIGEYQKAVDFIKSAIEKDKNNSNYYSDLGYSYSLMRNFSEAERAFLKSIELDKKNHPALNNLAWLYCENNVFIKEAIGYSIKACELSPLNDAYLDTLAEAYYLDKQYDKAIETINKAIKINPNYTYLTQQLEKIKKAREEMEKNK
ncbi:MAG TPA: tetratricopeptide repeat protein, partial [Spirochaetota bacterium]|nr:tetratricopeptide repeat protein [Spirochaetota bacterium]